MRKGLASQKGQLDAEILVIDPHERWGALHLLKARGLSPQDLEFPLLVDPSLTVSATYGVAFQMRVHTEESNRPATFLIDKEGILRYAHRAKTYSDRPKTAVIIEELKKMR